MARTSLKLVRNVLALMLLVVATACAQGEPPNGQRPQGPPTPAMELERLSKAMTDASLPLSDTQQTGILSVYQDGQTAAKAAQSSDASSDQATRQQQMQTLMASVRKEVRALLTEDQQKVFDTMKPLQGRGRGMNGSVSDSQTPPDAPPTSQQ